MHDHEIIPQSGPVECRKKDFLTSALLSPIS
jgi:hypothetical protein